MISLFKKSILLILIFIPHILHAQDRIPEQVADSIQKIIYLSEGENKLRAYSKLCDIYLDDTQAVINNINNFIREAQEQKHIKAEATAREYKVERMSNFYMDEMFDAEIEDHLNFFRKHEIWESYFYCTTIYINNEIHLTRFEKALMLSSNMYEEAKQANNGYGEGTACFCMGKAYKLMQRYADAEPFFRKAIMAFEKESEMAVRNNSYNNLCMVLIQMEQYEKTFEVLKEWEKAIEKYVLERAKIKPYEEEKSLFETYRYDCYSRYCETFILTEEYKSAQLYLDKAKKQLKHLEKNRMNLMLYEMNLCEKYEKNYTKGLRLVDTLENYYRQVDDKFGLLPVLRMKLRLLIRDEKAEEAISAYLELDSMQNSLLNVEMTAKLDEIRTTYEIDKFELKAQKDRNTILALVIGCVLLLLIGILIFIYSRRLRAQNRLLYQQIQEQDKLEKEIEEKNTIIFQNSSDSEQLRNGKLFAALKELMKNDAIYSQPDIDRKAIADLLNTNEKYLFDSIKENTGMSFSEYLLNLRLNHAKQLLSEDNNLTVEDIALRSGFGSRTTFHRQFREKYKLSPAEFHKLAMEKK